MAFIWKHTTVLTNVVITVYLKASDTVRPNSYGSFGLTVSKGKIKMLESLKIHARFIVVFALLSSAVSLFLIHFYPDKAIYLWCFGAAMIFLALIIAVFFLTVHT